jgi:hypothetical protein
VLHLHWNGGLGTHEQQANRVDGQGAGDQTQGNNDEERWRTQLPERYGCNRETDEEEDDRIGDKSDKIPERQDDLSASLLIPREAAHLFRDDAAHPFRLIVARHSD